MTDNDAVCPQLIDIFCELFGEKYRESITAETDMDAIPEWDSLSFMNVVLALEKCFGVTFSPDEAAQMFQVGHIQCIIDDIQNEQPHPDVANANCLIHLLHKTKKDNPVNCVILSGSSTREGFLPSQDCQEILDKQLAPHVNWSNISVSGLVVAESLQVLETLGGGWNGCIFMGIAPSIVFGCGTNEFSRSANHARFRFRARSMEKILKANGYSADPDKAKPVIPFKDWLQRYLKGRTAEDILYNPYYYPTLKPWEKSKFESIDDFMFFYGNAPENFEESQRINRKLFDAVFQWRDKVGIPIVFIELTSHSSLYRHYSAIMGSDVRARYKEFLDELIQKYNVPYIDLPALAEIKDADFRDPAHIYQGRRRMTKVFAKTVSDMKIFGG